MSLVLLLLWQYPSPPPEYINFLTISLLGQRSSSGSNRGIAHFFIAIRNTIKGVGKNNKRTICLGSFKCKKGDSVTLCIPLCICRLTLAWISSEISTKLLRMPTHLDRSSLTVAGFHLMRLVSSAPVSTGHSASPVANRLLWVPSSNSLRAFSSYFQWRRDLESKPFVWVRTKTDKGIVCWADHLHSVTLVEEIQFLS